MSFYCKKCRKLVHDDEIDKGCPYCGCDKFYEFDDDEVNDYDYDDGGDYEE